MGLADAAGAGFVCVQPLAVARAREGDDYTRDKTDHRDAYLIGKLVIRLDCYLPERAGEDWARLRHLGARRFALVADIVSCMQQAGDLLGCAWPAPLGSGGAAAGVGDVAGRDGGDHGPVLRGSGRRLREMGYDKFVAAVRRELPRWGGKFVRHSIAEGHVGGAGRYRRGGRAAPRRAGAGAPAAGRLAGAAGPAGRYRGRG